MTTKRSLFFAVMLGCVLAASGGCMTRKGFIVSGDVKLELNRVPWRTGPGSGYEAGPGCLECGQAGCCCSSPCGGPCSAPVARNQFHAIPRRPVFSPAPPASVDEEVVPGSERVIEEEVFADPDASPPRRFPGSDSPAQQDGSSTQHQAKPIASPNSPAYRRSTRPPRDQTNSTLKLRRSSWIFRR